MALVGRKPALSLSAATYVRNVSRRRRALKAQIAALKAELRALPTGAALAAELGVHSRTISSTACERYAKHHLIDAKTN